MLSTTGIFIKFLLDDFHMEPLALAFLRVSIVTLALGIVLRIFRPNLFKIQRRHLMFFAVYGLIGVGLHQLLWITSVNINGVGVATVLVYIQPAIVVLISWRFLGEALTRTKLIALALTLTGIVLVSQAYELGSGNLNWLGIIAGVGTGVTWATYALFGRYTSRHYTPWTSLFYAFFFGTLFLLPFQLFVPNTFALDGNLVGWAVLLFLALGPTLGGFALYTIGLSQIPASIVTLLGTLEPVFTIILAYFLFGEVLDFAQIIGAGLILWSVIMLRPRTSMAME